MAIKRLNPKATFKIISQTDTALDMETPEELVTGTDAEGNQILKESRYEKYVGNADFDESHLKFKEGQQPERFVVRALLADERAELNSKYTFVDTAAKRVVFTNRDKLFLDTFSKAFQGLEDANGVLQKLSPEELPYEVRVEIGALVQMLGNLSKNEKKS